MKRNANIINWLNKTQIKKGKTDLNKYKFLFGQQNNQKQLVQKDDFINSSIYSNKINPYSMKTPQNLVVGLDKYKKCFFGQDERNTLECSTCHHYGS
jgi:hypothetical protein